MRRNSIVALALASCILLSLTPSAQATSGWRSDWNAYYGKSQSCSTCHTSTPNLNSYGTALVNASGQTREEVFVAVEILDSDGGGATNGQEIVVNSTDPANPADDATVPNEGTTWGAIQALFK